MTVDLMLQIGTQCTRTRRMGLGDLDFVVEQHLTHFPDNPFSRLGPRFLRNYYRTFLDGPHAAALVVTQNHQPVAYMVGILDAVDHRRLLQRYHGRALAASALRGAARRPLRASPLVVHRIGVEARRRVRWAFTAAPSQARPQSPARASAQHSSTTTPYPPVAVLSHVAVSAAAQRLGLGRMLVSEFVLAATAAGAARACVATSTEAVAANNLYLRLGWKLERERATFDNRRIALYELPLGISE